MGFWGGISYSAGRFLFFQGSFSYHLMAWSLSAVVRKLWDSCHPPPPMCNLNLGCVRALLFQMWSTDEHIGLPWKPVKNVESQAPFQTQWFTICSFYKVCTWFKCTVKFEKCWDRPVLLRVCLQDQQQEHDQLVCYKYRTSDGLNQNFHLKWISRWTAPTLKLGKHCLRFRQIWLEVLATVT